MPTHLKAMNIKFETSYTPFKIFAKTRHDLSVTLLKHKVLPDEFKTFGERSL